MMRPDVRLALAGVAGILFVDPASALDPDARGRAHKLPPLACSADVAAAAPSPRRRAMIEGPSD